LTHGAILISYGLKTRGINAQELILFKSFLKKMALKSDRLLGGGEWEGEPLPRCSYAYWY